MSRSVEQYKKLLRTLSPKGRALSKDPDSFFEDLLESFAVELSRVDARVYDLIREKNTQTTEELLTEFEEEFDILDPEITTEERREVIRAKLLKRGAQHKEYFEEIADTLGYNVYIDEYIPFWAGIATAGDPCGDNINLFKWKMLVDVNGIIGSFESGPFSSAFSTRQLDDVDYVSFSIIRKFYTLMEEVSPYKPGHTRLNYDFYNRAFDRGFGWGFDAFPHNDATNPFEQFSSAFGNGFANQREYDEKYLIGSYDNSFSLAFNIRAGGAYHKDAFSSAFDIPL